MQPDDWDRFLFYHAFIHALSFGEEKTGEFHDLRVLAIIASHPDQTAIFPNLRLCCLELKSVSLAAASTPFLKRPFRELFIDFKPQGDQSSSAIPVIHALLDAVGAELNPVRLFSFNLLDELEIEKRWEGQLVLPITRLLSRLPALKSLDITSYTDGYLLMPCIAGLVGLESFSAALHSSTNCFEEKYDLPPAAFSCLKELRIGAGDCSKGRPPLIPLIKGITSAFLTSLTVEIESWAILEGIHQVVASKWSSTFSSLSVGIFLDDADGISISEVPMHTFLPLNSCRNLETLIVTAFEPLTFADEHFDSMTRAWPLLQTLRVEDEWLDDWDGEDRPMPHTSHRSLVYFATRCPALKGLDLPVYFDLAAARSESAAITSFTSKLEELDISSSYFSGGSTDDLVTYLRTIFPNLKETGLTLKSDANDEEGLSSSDDGDADEAGSNGAEFGSEVSTDGEGEGSVNEEDEIEYFSDEE